MLLDINFQMGFYDFIEAIVGCCLMKSCPVCTSNVTLNDIEQCPTKNFSLVVCGYVVITFVYTYFLINIGANIMLLNV